MTKLLDTTLRDGSYIIDFQFTADDTAVISAALDANNVHYIEVGHGVGLGAFRNPRMASAVTDEGYLAATAGAVKQNKWGMFFIPGIATMEDLERASEYGMSFIRIGTNVTETEQATAFIARAKALGMEVFANFMKTYAVSPEEVARRARQVEGDGADCVCVVDSAGGMLPEDVTAYVGAVRNSVAIAVGYHGHNNLGMAVANTLVAVEQGASIIDTSLRGMGRSAGNASTEMTLFALLRRGIDLGIDPVAMLTLAEQRIDPLIARGVQERSIGVVTGYAQFHSSYLGVVEEVASERHVDTRELIIGVTRENKIDAPRKLVELVADALASQPSVQRRVSTRVVNAVVMDSSAPLDQQVKQLATRLRAAAKRGSRPSVLNVVQSIRRGLDVSISSSMHEGNAAFIGTIEVGTGETAACVCSAADGIVDYMLVDTDCKSAESDAIVAALRPAESGLLRYSDLDAWTGTVLDTVGEFRNTSLANLQILVAGDRTAPLVHAMTTAAAERGARIHSSSTLSWSATNVPDVVIVCDDSSVLHRIPGEFDGSPLIVVDAWIGAVSELQANELRQRGTLVLRPDMRAALQAQIFRSLAIRELVADVSGCTVFEGIPIAAGGVVAPRGTIIVDSVTHPSAIHGVADGAGALQQQRALDGESIQLLERARTLVLHTVG